MALSHDEVSEGLLYELDQFEQLVRPLTAAEWATPSRCAGWTVGDVARHVVGSLADVAAGRLDGLGTPAVTKREVDERAGRTPTELADECVEVRAAAAGLLPLFDDAAWAGTAPGGYEGTLGDGVEALWYDTWLHADDIRAALGRESVIGPSLTGAVSHVGTELAKLDWNDALPTEDESAFRFILAATGRAPSAAGGPPNLYA